MSEHIKEIKSEEFLKDCDEYLDLSISEVAELIGVVVKDMLVWRYGDLKDLEYHVFSLNAFRKIKIIDDFISKLKEISGLIEAKELKRLAKCKLFNSKSAVECLLSEENEFCFRDFIKDFLEELDHIRRCKEIINDMESDEVKKQRVKQLNDCWRDDFHSINFRNKE